MKTTEPIKEYQKSIATTLRERQDHDAALLSHLQEMQAADLCSRSDEEDNPTHQHIRQDAAQALKDSQARRAAALKNVHAEHAAALKKIHAEHQETLKKVYEDADEELEGKNLLISWLTGGYSLSNQKEE